MCVFPLSLREEALRPFQNHTVCSLVLYVPYADHGTQLMRLVRLQMEEQNGGGNEAVCDHWVTLLLLWA